MRFFSSISEPSNFFSSEFVSSEKLFIFLSLSKQRKVLIIIIIITLFNEGKDIDYWSPSSFHNGPPRYDDLAIFYSLCYYT